MKIFTRFGLFARETDPILDDEGLKELGLKPCKLFSLFCEDHISQLEQFCKKNPTYHIISRMPNGAFNKTLPNAYYYYLARGSKDPHLVYLDEPANQRP